MNGSGKIAVSWYFRKRALATKATITEKLFITEIMEQIILFSYSSPSDTNPKYSFLDVRDFAW